MHVVLQVRHIGHFTDNIKTYLSMYTAYYKITDKITLS